MSTTLSCGQCGSPLRPDQGWCSLCYAAIRPTIDPLTAPLEEVLGLEETEDQIVDEEPPSKIQPGVHAGLGYESAVAVQPQPQPEDEAPAVDITEIDVMLSMLAAEHRQSEPVAGLAERLSDKPTRVTVMVGGTLLVGLVLFGILTALGALL